MSRNNDKTRFATKSCPRNAKTRKLKHLSDSCGPKSDIWWTLGAKRGPMGTPWGTLGRALGGLEALGAAFGEPKVPRRPPDGATG